MARGEADGGAGAVGDGDGHVWLLDVDPGPFGSPDDEDEVLAGFVAEFIGIWAVGAEPDVAGGGIAVDAEGAKGHFRHELDGVAGREGTASLLDSAGDSVLVC